MEYFGKTAFKSYKIIWSLLICELILIKLKPNNIQINNNDSR